ncbi:unnamed protein product [Urochloa decumbens]|uniref:KIB1-4 beta-propeller domain-containing protein n=1 Tax=Urochloa decumbens TaxID=240449 RepID=A0ABC8XAQ8_9POAL
MVDVPAPPLRPWADLDADLISCIGDCCVLTDYASCLAVCAAWRSALPPPLSLPLAVLPADAAAGHPAVSVAACFLRARRWSRLPGLRCPTALIGGAAASCRCVGARDGWIALVATAAADGGALLFNPFTGTEIPLHASLYDPARDAVAAPKIVFSPDPTPRDFAAVSVTRPNRIAVQRAADGYSDSVVEYTNHLMDGADLVDVAYGGGGKVYCLAKGGEVYVLRLKRRRRRGAPWLPALEVGPLHRAPLGADAFPAPYNVISQHTDAKNLLLYDGALYQVWRRPTGAGSVTVDTPAAGGKRWVRISEGDVFVLRYEPGRWPRWAVAEWKKDLGGNAVFVGSNDAAVVRGEGVSVNSVYYWDNPPEGGHEPVVFNMATRASVRWPAVATGGTSSPVWYISPAATDEEATCEETACPEYDDEHSADM